MLTPQVRRLLAWLIVAGAITHFSGLTYPRQVVFDEVHWGKSVTAYCCTRERVFDVHPPHGKLLLTLGAVAGGYKGDQSFETIGQPYGQQPVFFLRLIPALAGILIPPLFFLLIRGLGGSIPTALLGGVLLTVDNALLLETRLLLFDGILVAAFLASLVCLLAADSQSTRGWSWACIAASGAFGGLAIGTKFTALALIPLITLYLASRAWRRPSERGVRSLQWLVIVAAGLVVYLAGWAVHFALLRAPGPADAFHPTTGRFFQDFWVVHKTMLEANIHLAQSHPDASLPWTWPLMKVAPYFWNGEGASIYMVGNPVVWWGSSLLFVVILVNGVLMRVTRLRIETQPGAPRPALKLWVPIAGYLLAFLPFFGITRVLFMYHYFTPLVLSLAAVLLWLERAGWIQSDRLGGQRRSYYAVMAAAVIAFLLVSPLTYGFSAGGYDEWLTGIVRSWR